MATQTRKPAEEKVYIVPELEIRISESWVNLIHWCQTSFPHGDIKIKIVNGLPTELLEQHAKIRFDKQNTMPLEK